MKITNVLLSSYFLASILIYVNVKASNFQFFNVNQSVGLLNNSLLIFTSNINKLRCLNTCKLVSNCKIILFCQTSLECRAYSQSQYFDNDADLPEMQIYALIKQEGELINTYNIHSSHLMSIVQLNNGYIASGSFDNFIRIWNPFDSKISMNISNILCNGIHNIKLLRNNLLAAACENKTIQFFNTTNGSLVRVLSGHNNVVKFVIEIDNVYLVSASVDQTIKIWNINKGVLVKTLDNHTDQVWALALLKDGNLASGSHDTTIIIWNLTTFTSIKRLNGTSPVQYLETLDNVLLASASQDGIIRIWDVFSGKIAKILEGHSNYVRCLLLYNDDILISGSNDKTIKLWNLSSGKEEINLKGHQKRIISLAKLKNGNLASGSEDGQIKIWRI